MVGASSKTFTSLSFEQHLLKTSRHDEDSRDEEADRGNDEKARLRREEHAAALHFSVFHMLMLLSKHTN